MASVCQAEAPIVCVRLPPSRAALNLLAAETITPTRHAKGVIDDAAGSGLGAQEACRRRRRGLGIPHRTGGPGSKRLQRGGFSSERDAAEALERALEHLRRQKGVGSTLTLRELVEEYLAQHDGSVRFSV
jgi:hypothetical protein